MEKERKKAKCIPEVVLQKFSNLRMEWWKRDEEEFVVKGHDYEVIKKKKKKRKEAKGRKQKEKSEGSKEKSVTRNGKKN